MCSLRIISVERWHLPRPIDEIKWASTQQTNTYQGTPCFLFKIKLIYILTIDIDQKK